MSPVAVPAHEAVNTVEVALQWLPHAHTIAQELPFYATTGAAGMDVRAAIAEPVTLEPFERRLIPTGFAIALPDGHECQVRPRSGLSIKHGITLINCVGTIDSDYRHEVMVPLVNLSQQAYTLQPGERIAQLVIAPVTRAQWQVVPTLPSAISNRQGGFGSTGLQ